MYRTPAAFVAALSLGLAITAPVHAASGLDAVHVTTAIKTGMARAAAAQNGSGEMPPASYTGQTWRTPNMCDYSRAGRPGEVIWYLISNTAHKGCKTYIVQKSFGDVYN